MRSNKTDHIGTDANGYYRAAIGCKRNKKGDVVKAQMSLGKELMTAVLLRNAYRHVWDTESEPTDGTKKHWNAEMLRLAQRMAAGFKEQQQMVLSNASRTRAIADAAEHAALRGRQPVPQQVNVDYSGIMSREDFANHHQWTEYDVENPATGEIVRTEKLVPMFRTDFDPSDAIYPTRTIARRTTQPASDAPVIVVEVPAAKTQVMFFDALDAYVQAKNAKPGSHHSQRRLPECIKAFKRYIDLANEGKGNMPLASVNRQRLEEITDFIKSRPISKNANKKTGKREPISVHTVVTVLAFARQAFDWIDSYADEARFDGWEAPRRWRELFTVEKTKIMTKRERDRMADGPEQITLAEIKSILHVGNTRQRMLVLTSLFAGMGQSELSSAYRSEFNLSKATFAHRRNKTGQRGEYWLPTARIRIIRCGTSPSRPVWKRSRRGFGI